MQKLKATAEWKNVLSLNPHQNCNSVWVQGGGAHPSRKLHKNYALYMHNSELKSVDFVQFEITNLTVLIGFCHKIKLRGKVKKQKCQEINLIL